MTRARPWLVLADGDGLTVQGSAGPGSILWMIGVRVSEQRSAPVYAVAGGNHVTILVSAQQTGGAFDVIEVVAAPGGGPPPHQHEFVEWFYVVEGELQLTGERDGAIVPIAAVRAGETVRVDAWEWHGTVNATSSQTRFVVTAQPGEMSSYFAEAGVLVPNAYSAPDHEPPGPAELTVLAQRCGIRF